MYNILTRGSGVVEGKDPVIPLGLEQNSIEALPLVNMVPKPIILYNYVLYNYSNRDVCLYRQYHYTHNIIPSL